MIIMFRILFSLFWKHVFQGKWHFDLKSLSFIKTSSQKQTRNEFDITSNLKLGLNHEKWQFIVHVWSVFKKKWYQNKSLMLEKH